MSHPFRILRLYTICVLTYGTAWALYAGLPGNTESSWKSYIPLKINGSSTDITAHFQSRNLESVLSLDTAEVSFQEFSVKKQYTLRHVASTYDAEDLRIDPFIQNMLIVFMDEGSEWLFLSNERSQLWISKQMKTHFPEREWSFGTRGLSSLTLFTSVLICALLIFCNKGIRVYTGFISIIFVFVAPMFHIATVLLLAMVLQAIAFVVSRVWKGTVSYSQKVMPVKRFDMALLGALFVGFIFFILFQPEIKRLYLFVLYLATLSASVWSLSVYYNRMRKRDHRTFVGYRLVTQARDAFSDLRVLVFSLSACACVLFGLVPFKGSETRISPHEDYRQNSYISRDLFIQHSKYQEALLYGRSFEESKHLSEIVIPNFRIDDSYAIDTAYRTLSLDSQWEHKLLETLGSSHALQLLLRENAESLSIGDRIYSATSFSIWLPILFWICCMILVFVYNKSLRLFRRSLLQLPFSFRFQRLWRVSLK